MASLHHVWQTPGIAKPASPIGTRICKCMLECLLKSFESQKSQYWFWDDAFPALKLWQPSGAEARAQCSK
jgi:hypothetical protein